MKVVVLPSSSSESCRSWFRCCFVSLLPLLLLLLLSALLIITIVDGLATTTGAEAAAVVESSSSSNIVSNQFKAPNNDTPSKVVAEWKKQDEDLWNYVEHHVPAVLDHTGSAAFDEHLKGVQSVLRYWDASTYLTNAGLFHSIYGTEGFQGFALPLTERSTIQQLIGDKAEKLCFWFCMVDRSTLDKTVFDYNCDATATGSSSTTFELKSRPELGRFTIRMDKEEWLDFIELALADWLEQVEGAAMKPSDLFLWKVGEAYAYRRLAYRKMSQILAKERHPRLSEVVPRMLEAVMSTEDTSTRHLIQPRTPPVSDAAAQALMALRASDAGGADNNNNEDTPIMMIPEDLSPQPMTKQQLEEIASSVKDEL